METIAAARTYAGKPAGERRAARRDALIEAAIRLYGRHGYRNVGVRAVCQEAGLTERYFYEGFANSDALLAAAHDAVVGRLIGELREAGGGAALPPVARAERMLSAYFAAIRAHPAAARVFLIEIGGAGAAIGGAIEASLERFAALILDVLDPARAGPLAAAPLLRRGVVGGLHRIAIAWLSVRDDPPGEAVAAAMPLCLLALPTDAAS